ncbi:predicted protein, partial [Nematostella vectensis]
MAFYGDSATAQIALTTFFSFLVVTDLIGNTLVILVIVTNKTARTPMNFLLINLAVADMMVAIFIAPRFLFMNAINHPEGLAGTIICKLITGGNFSWTGGACSVFTLVAIAFERYYAVMYPYNDKGKMSIKKLRYIFIGVWLGAAVLNLPLFLTIYYEASKHFCFEYWPPDLPWLPIAYASVWWAAAGVFPIFSMAFLYTRVVYNLWFKRSESGNPAQQAVIRYRKRATKMVITVSVIYAFCWLPILTTYMLSYAHPQFKYGDVTHIATIGLSTLNSSVNPLVYTFQNVRFRKLLKDLVCCKQSRNRVDTSGTTNTSHTARKRST